MWILRVAQAHTFVFVFLRAARRLIYFCFVKSAKGTLTRSPHVDIPVFLVILGTTRRSRGRGISLGKGYCARFRQPGLVCVWWVLYVRVYARLTFLEWHWMHIPLSVI